MYFWLIEFICGQFSKIMPKKLQYSAEVKKSAEYMQKTSGFQCIRKNMAAEAAKRFSQKRKQMASIACQNAPKGRKYEPGGFIARYVNRLSKRKPVDRRNRRLAQGKFPPRPSLKMPNGKGKEGYCEYTASKV